MAGVSTKNLNEDTDKKFLTMSVAQLYEGKNIFVTGATGFLGKTLIEKLLRSCTGIENIYILLRPKRGCGIEERLQVFLNSSIFEVLKRENPDALNKIIAVKGDVTELKLGLSESDRKMLVENVNIIFHSAASIRFDDFFDKAIIMNVRGTREVAQLALDLKNLTMFVHISTAFSNTGECVIEEKLYPPHANWQEAITLAEQYDKKLLCAMTQKYIDPYPNTYTFAKGLGEHVVNDMCAGKIPAIITRPSIVFNSLEEPVMGWNDNFNGPIGLLTAGGKGLCRISLGSYNNYLNYVPVDIVVKGIILASFDCVTKNKKHEIEVYNINQQTINCSLGEFIELGIKMCLKSPLPNLMWYPSPGLTASTYNFYAQVLLFHMLPAIFLDILLRLIGKKPMVVSLQRKIYIAIYVLRHFTLNNYEFKYDKMINIQKNLTDKDRAFSYPDELTKEEVAIYISQCIDGIIKYVLKEAIDPTRQKELKSLRRFWYAHIALKTFIISFLSWLLLIKLNFIGWFINGIHTYFLNL